MKMKTWKKKHLPQDLGTENLRKKERKNVISNENKNKNNTKKIPTARRPKN